MHHIKSELKIMGINPILISFSIVVAFSLLAFIGGELLNLSIFGYEVIFPFFAAIAVGEWGKSKADDNYDVIVSQGKSLFNWVLVRFLSVFTMVSLFAILSMLLVFIIRDEMTLVEMILIYFAPSFFLATLAAFLNICFSKEHISTLLCGIIWLVTILTRSLLRFPGVEYIYLSIRYAGDVNNIWLINKIILLLISLLLWIFIFFWCKRCIE